MAKLDPVPYKAFHTLSKLYGGLTRLAIAGTNMLLITDMEDMKKAMNNQDLDDRLAAPTTYIVLFQEALKRGSFSFLFKNNSQLDDLGAQWRELRRFMLKSLRDLGYGKSASEEAILHEATLIVEQISQKMDENNGTVSLGNIFNCAALNVVWNLIAGRKFDYDDANMAKLIDAVNSFMVIGKDVIGKPLGSMPWLRFVPPFRSKMAKVEKDLEAFRKFIWESIEERKAIKEKESSCFIDMFLAAASEDTTGLYTEEQLVHLCVDLFLGGSETTSKSQATMIALMVYNPDVQAKIHAELDSVANGRTFIDLNDKANLPYTEAAIFEAWRRWPVVPVGPPRVAYKDVQIGGYTVPAGTAVLYNTHTLHMDHNIFKDPELYRPERLIVNGKFENERIMPFGIGRRKCLGESLAKMESFLFFANIMLNYSFKAVNGELPDLGPEAGFTNGPYPYRVHITRR